MHLLSSRSASVLYNNASKAYLSRYLSNRPLSGYHSKVAAYPFTLSPTAALETFAQFPLTPHILNSFDPLKLPDYFSKFGLNIPKATEEHALKPDKFSAVYFPAWFLYAALRDKQAGPGVLVNRAYIPGYQHAILSHTSFNIQSQILEHELGDPQPWTESLRTQHDQDVLCLPYQSTPLYTESDFSPNASMTQLLKATRLDVEFLAVHPVLVPLYLAQYHDLITQAPITVVIEAHTQRVYCTRLLKDATNAMMQVFSSSSRIAAWVGSYLVKFADDWDRQRKRASVGRLLHFSGTDTYPAIHGLVKAEIPKRGVDRIPAQLLGHLAKLPQTHAMDDSSHRGMEDLRVRPFTRQAGRESNECAQYAIGASLLAQESSAQVLREEMESSLKRAAPWWLEWKASQQSRESS